MEEKTEFYNFYKKISDYRYDLDDSYYQFNKIETIMKSKGSIKEINKIFYFMFISDILYICHYDRYTWAPDPKRIKMDTAKSDANEMVTRSLNPAVVHGTVMLMDQRIFSKSL